MNRNYSWVIPNYFDLDDWPQGDGAGDYVVYMGRICPEKGMRTLVEIIKAMPDTKFVFAGQGDFDGLIGKHSNVEYVGPVHGKARATLVGNARCMVMPTDFIEPFGGSGVEAMLCGTPLVAVDYGAFTETIDHGRTGYRCKTLGDWVRAIELCQHMRYAGMTGPHGMVGRGNVAAAAQSKYSLQAVAPLYDAAFKQIADLSQKGWYTMEARNV
jgi:glycosyltransferase involved in cell wall biosynthesis